MKDAYGIVEGKPSGKNIWLENRLIHWHIGKLQKKKDSVIKSRTCVGLCIRKGWGYKK
jgi:hypothetical protein